MFTAFVDYQMMVAQWAVILVRNGSIRVVAQTKLLESTSGTVPNTLLSDHNSSLYNIICFFVSKYINLDLMIHGANILLLTINA